MAGLQQIDAQPLRRHGHFDLILHVLEGGDLLHGLLNLLFDVLQLRFGERQGFPNARAGGSGLTALAGGVLKIAPDGLLDFFAGAQ